jgi:hypothetical protein
MQQQDPETGEIPDVKIALDIEVPCHIPLRLIALVLEWLKTADHKCRMRLQRAAGC